MVFISIFAGRKQFLVGFRSFHRSRFRHWHDLHFCAISVPPIRSHQSHTCSSLYTKTRLINMNRCLATSAEVPLLSAPSAHCDCESATWRSCSTPAKPCVRRAKQKPKRVLEHAMNPSQLAATNRRYKIKE